MHLELLENPGKNSMYKYPAMTKTMTGAEVPGTPIQTFKLHVERGQFTDSEIVVMLGKVLCISNTLIDVSFLLTNFIYSFFYFV